MTEDKTSPCDCTEPGFCPRFQRRMVGRLFDICRGTSGLRPEVEERYRKLWLAEAGNGEPAHETFDCIHRGPRSRTELCKLCGNREVPVEVHFCARHGECTVHAHGIQGGNGKLPVCVGCPDRLEAAPAAASPAAASTTAAAPRNGAPHRSAAPRESTGEKLILKHWLSPGDVTVMTAALRELHAHYPGKYITDVRTPCADLFQNNPFVTPLADGDPQSRLLELHYDRDEYYSIHRSNQHPVHFIEAFCQNLANAIGVPHLRPKALKGDIHLAPDERRWVSQVQEITGRPTPFWVVNAGGKTDFTCKIWPIEFFQEVIDRTRGRITWVQVGEAGHTHPRIKGVMDFVGKTTLRQLVRLVYHSRGVLSGNSLLMHLAAAVERPPDAQGFARPCIVLAGGREPVRWFQYPGHQVLHTIGAIDCCREGGCWRSRTVPLRDGQPHDRSLCARPMDGAPHCMRLITPQHVVQILEMYC